MSSKSGNRRSDDATHKHRKTKDHVSSKKSTEDLARDKLVTGGSAAASGATSSATASSAKQPDDLGKQGKKKKSPKIKNGTSLHMISY